MFHNLDGRDKTLDEFKSNWQEILTNTQHRNLKYQISFTGGEVSINTDFLPFVHWLNDNFKDSIHAVGITTNGSAQTEYYSQLLDLDIVSYISFSTHSEFFNERKFFETVVDRDARAKRLNKTVHVNVMNEHWNTQRNQAYMDFLSKQGINCSLNEIDYSQLIRTTARINTSKQLYNFDE
jgi:molybdenum cofactor biosynthesis enzyme MoaA